MSTFNVTIEVGSLDGSRWEPVQVLVDTGATLTKAPGRLLEGLGISPSVVRRARPANGQVVERRAGDALVRINGEQHANLVTFGEQGEDPLLGSVTLETFSLAVDPVNRRLVPVDSLELMS